MFCMSVQSPLALFLGDLCHITALWSTPMMERASAHHLKQEGPWNPTKLAWERAHWQYTSTQTIPLVWKSSRIIESEWCWNVMTTYPVVAGRIYCWWQPGERERTRLKERSEEQWTHQSPQSVKECQKAEWSQAKLTLQSSWDQIKQRKQGGNSLGNWDSVLQIC